MESLILERRSIYDSTDIAEREERLFKTPIPNMKSNSRKNSYWQDVAQDKKVPSTRLRTRAVVESDGATSSSATRRNLPSTSTQQGNPSEQESTVPGTQQLPQQRTKRNKRDYDTLKWSIEEKKILLFCFTYSRFEKWGRLKKQVFEEQLKEAELSPEKIKATTIRKLESIISQIHVYLPKEEIVKIQKEALSKAANDFDLIGDEKQLEYGKSHWKREEKWVLLWAIEYARAKYTNQQQQCKEWQKIFKHHCPQKKEIPRDRLTSQKYNFIVQKVFTEEEMNDMKDRVKEMVESQKCPLSEPLEVPTTTSTPIPKKKENKPPHVQLNPSPHGMNREEEDNRSPQRLRTVLAPPEPPDSPSSSSSSDPDEPDSPERPLRRPRINQTPPRPPEDRLPVIEPEQRELEEELANVIEETKGWNMEERPRLIKLRENKSFKELLKKVNQCITRLIPVGSSLTEINCANYGAALYIQNKLAPDYVKKRGASTRKKSTIPPWKKKIEQKISQLRAELSQMSMYLNSQNHGRNLLKKIDIIKRKYNVNNAQIEGRMAEHQATVKALAAEIRNKEKKFNTKQINKQFAENPRIVYRNLARETITVQDPPKAEEVERFWRPLFEDPKQHQESQWIETIKEKNRGKQQMAELVITEEVVRKKIKEFSNFKAPGIDKIPNFWLKKMAALHPHYALSFMKIQKGEEQSPEWLTIGNTSLLPKSNETQLPNKYRPICCLSTTYKWLTGIIADAIYEHLDTGDYLEKEQKGCIRNKLGTKDQLLINKTILEDCKRRQRNLSMAWIDYKKAFDSVPHSWILRCLDLYNINRDIRTFMSNQMEKWKTSITLNHAEGQIQIKDVKIQRGIFQGDSLSPLLFCLAVDPLSKILKQHDIGYDLSKERRKKDKKKINHLLFMDDLKIYAETDQKLNQLIEAVREFSSDIKMEFGLDKCSKCTIKKGKKIAAENILIGDGSSIEDLDEDASYKYLGIEENATIEHKKMREKVTKEYLSRLKKICKSELTPKNKITAINQLAIPVVTYGFGIIDWPQYEIDKLDVKTRKWLTLHKVIYRNQCLERIYIPRSEGGLGLIEIDHAHRASIVSLGQYLKSTEEENMKLVEQQHSETLPQNTSITKLANNFGGEFIVEREGNEHTPATKLARKARGQYSKKVQETRVNKWGEHRRAGRFQQELEKNYIDKEGSLYWLRNGILGYDGERILVGAQDQGLLTNGFKKMAGISDNDKCRFCHTEVESVSHLMSGCQILLADGYYTARHNKICRYLHWKICKEMNIEVKDNIWEHEPEPIVANQHVTIFYDKPIPVGRYIEGRAIKPDIVIWNKREKTANIIDVTVPNDYGLNRGEREKREKYEDLKNHLRTAWSLKESFITPVVVGATGLMKKNLKNCLELIPGNPSAQEVQIAAVKGTITILKRALGYSASNA